MALTKCAECKWEYPESLLNAMFANGKYTQPICGICALELTNKIHGAELTEFRGEIAEHMRQLAVRWRKRNPNYKPK